jgi:hypothetical protein
MIEVTFEEMEPLSRTGLQGHFRWRTCGQVTHYETRVLGPRPKVQGFHMAGPATNPQHAKK